MAARRPKSSAKPKKGKKQAPAADGETACLSRGYAHLQATLGSRRSLHALFSSSVLCILLLFCGHVSFVLLLRTIVSAVLSVVLVSALLSAPCCMYSALGAPYEYSTVRRPVCYRACSLTSFVLFCISLWSLAYFGLLCALIARVRICTDV